MSCFCWSIVPCTFFIWQFSPLPLLTHISQFHRFTIYNISTICAIFISEFSQETLAQLFAYLLTSHPGFTGMLHKMAIGRILTFIQVTVLKMRNSRGHTSWPLANLYIDPLMMNIKQWCEFCNAITRRVFTYSMFEMACICQNTNLCSGCLSANHLLGHCQYLLLFR